MKDKNQGKNMIMGITFGIIFGTSIGVNKGNLPLWLGVTRDLETEDIEIETPICKTTGKVISGKKVFQGS